MGYRSCPVCSCSRVEHIKKIRMAVPKDYRLPDSYEIAVCENCGFVFADTSASMEDYDWYYEHCNFYADDSKADNSRRYDMVKELLEQYCSRESLLLNIGSGNGRFEVAMKKHGYDGITGTDPSTESVEWMKKQGIAAHVRNIYTSVAEDEKQKYDGIFLFEVAEHLLFPGQGIENIEKMLKPGGVFILSVPDYGHVHESNTSIPNQFNLEHINYFSEYSLDNLMGYYGMKRIAQKRIGLDLIQCYVKEENKIAIEKDKVTAQSLQEYLDKQQGKLEKTQEIIEKLVQEQCEIVIWGTGSYMMSLMATTPLLNCKIAGFIDNNKIKQGREMYGYQIYPPEFLMDKNYAVLICSMLNSGEIQKQLEDMNTKNTIMVL